MAHLALPQRRSDAVLHFVSLRSFTAVVGFRDVRRLNASSSSSESSRNRAGVLASRGVSRVLLWK